MSSTATIEIIGSLEDFLNPSTKKPATASFDLHPSAKDLIESQGIPHSAIFKMIVNGEERPLDYNLQDGDEISIYPFEKVDSNDFEQIYLKPTSFIVDVHLGKLAKTLRLLGFDTLWEQDLKDKEIIKHSNEQQRMILTRDVELLKNGATQYGYWVRSTDPDQQIEELFQRFLLVDQINAFTRCMKCNGVLNEASLDQVEDQLPPKVKEWHSTFFECENCGQVYWQGSHYKKLKEKVQRLIKLS